MAAVTVSSYFETIETHNKEIFANDKPIVVDSKVLMLALDCKEEAFYVCGVINSPIVRKVIDGYAIFTNRGIDVLKNIYIPKFNKSLKVHNDIARISMQIHEKYNTNKKEIPDMELELDRKIKELYKKI